MKSGLSTSAIQRHQLARIIRKRALTPAYQPIVNMRTGRVDGVEALCRPRVGVPITTAGELFAAGERFSMLWPLECAARRAIVNGVHRWPGAMRLFLNCSPRVFADARFLSELDALVRACPGLERTHTVLELTEHGEHGPALRRCVRTILEHGYELAIDDVGAGMSGLSRIMALRPHWLKLDMDLIRDIHLDPLRQNLVRAVAQFALASNMRLIAEGVECSAEFRTLVATGVSYAQGHYLAPPCEALRPEWAHARAA